MLRGWFALVLLMAVLVGCADIKARGEEKVTPLAPLQQALQPSPWPTPTVTAEPTAAETHRTPLPVLAITLLTPAPSVTLPTIDAQEDIDPYIPPTTRPRAAPTATPFLLPTVLPVEPITGTVHARAIYRGDRSRPRAALTFDTGQGLPTVIQILDQLKAADIHATFFVMGIWANKNGGVVRRMAAEGHELANHSYSHPNFNTISDDQITAQVQWTEQIVHGLTGCITRPFLRPPFGAASAHTQQVLAGAGYYDIMWSAHGGDWLPGATAESVRQMVTRNSGNGSIIILHSSAPQTAQALAGILSDLKAKELEIVTLGELLRDDPNYDIPIPCVPHGEGL